MKKSIKLTISFLICCILLSSCTTYVQKAKIMNEWEVLSIDNESPTGVIKKFDKNNAEDKMKESVLRSHLNELSGDIALAKVNVLGEAEGKIYTFNVYASYVEENGKVECKERSRNLPHLHLMNKRSMNHRNIILRKIF